MFTQIKLLAKKCNEIYILQFNYRRLLYHRHRDLYKYFSKNIYGNKIIRTNKQNVSSVRLGVITCCTNQEIVFFLLISNFKILQ